MAQSEYQPQSNFGKWWDDRLPIWRFGRDLMDYPTPANLNYWWTFGGILSFCLVVQIITGVLLAMHYTPHVDFAFSSVQHIMRDVNYGWLLRFVHSNGAAMFFLAVYIHIFRGLYYGSYKSPREVLWILGVVLYVLMIITAFMGYVLPWGQMSFWAATVITNLLGAFPLIGDGVRDWLWGGFAIGNPTLNRFFSLHYLLPFVIAAVVVLHVWALHHVRNNNPVGVEVEVGRDTLPFHPFYTMKDSFALVLFSLLFAWFVFFDPDIMGHPDNYIEANSLQTPTHIVPEWYLLAPYAILRAIPWKLGGVLAMFGSLFVLFLLPWLDRAPVRSARFRPLYRLCFIVFVGVCLGLGWLGGQPAEGVYIFWARVLTTYYFGFFLVLMPLLSKIEKPGEVPSAITQPVFPTSNGLR